MSLVEDLAGSERGHLLKILGVTFGVAVAVGDMIGSGILRAPSTLAATVPSIGLIMGLWVLGALNAALNGNVLAELGTAIPKSGGVYNWRAARVRRCWRFLIIGWANWLAFVAGMRAAAISFANFLPLLWFWPRNTRSVSRLRCSSACLVRTFWDFAKAARCRNRGRVSSRPRCSHCSAWPRCCSSLPRHLAAGGRSAHARLGCRDCRFSACAWCLCRVGHAVLFRRGTGRCRACVAAHDVYRDGADGRALSRREWCASARSARRGVVFAVHHCAGTFRPVGAVRATGL